MKLFSTRLCLWALAMSAAVGGARAETSAPAAHREAAAVAAFEANGSRLFEAGRFEEAIAEFRKAYEVQARPDLLLRIGRSYERLGQNHQALYFFRRFLATAAADAPERPDVQAIVDAAPLPPADVTGEEAESPAWAAPSTAAADAPPSPTLYKRWWLWAGVGAFALAGVALGVALWGGQDGIPPSDLGHKRFD